MSLVLGLESCLVSPPQPIRDSHHFGLLTHQAAVNRAFRHGADLMAARFPRRMASLFSPQHGLWATEQDNMIETGHARHPRLGLPVHSLYSETRKPTDEMLDGLDLLVVDMQDVGTRVYTFIWTLALCMQACAEKGIPVLVLDRPNPLGGQLCEGALLDPQFTSFVGGAAMPMRHGLTIGEFARWANTKLAIHCELHVEAMQGWQRSMLWQDTGRAWVPPSPNLPRHEGAMVYPGQVLLEGTNLSEGRGTTTPFEMWGAPFVDPWQLLPVLEPRDLAGCALRPVAFEPTFHKWQGQHCGGLFVHVTEPREFRPYRTTLAFLRAAQELWPEQTKWLEPPYEYEQDKTPIDILTGDTAVREWISATGSWQRLEELATTPAKWWTEVSSALLY